MKTATITKRMINNNVLYRFLLFILKLRRKMGKNNIAYKISTMETNREKNRDSTPITGLGIEICIRIFCLNLIKL
ncbi:MAG: hypothetical protein R6U96_04865 [Promethearchaeia archaeon]